MTKRTIATWIVLAASAGCGRSSSTERPAPPSCPAELGFLTRADELELVSLEPRGDGGERLHGWQVLGKTVIRGAKDRRDLVRMVGMNAAFASSTANCFEPRHAIRAREGDHAYDLLICFECDGMQLFVDGRETAIEPFAGFGRERLDLFLVQAGVPLAKPADAGE